MTTDQPLDISSIRSDILPILRSLRPLIDQFPYDAASLAQFTIVIDANVLLEDIRWHLLKRRTPDAQSSLQECLSAEIVKVYATRRVINEVFEHIPRIARLDGIDEGECRALMQKLMTRLQIIELEELEYQVFIDGLDPDDAPTLALEKLIDADGILSKDTDIKAMGGRTIPPEYMMVMRHYSRKAAISVTLQLGGNAIMAVSGGAVIAAFKLLHTAVRTVIALPTPVKLIALVFAVAWLSNPKNRETLAGRFGLAINKSGHALGEVFQLTATLLREAEAHKPRPLVLPTQDSTKHNDPGQ